MSYQGQVIMGHKNQPTESNQSINQSLLRVVS